MTGEFLKIQSEQYELFCRKQYDYGPQNIAVGTILKTPEDIKLSLLGLWFRMNDKIERMKTLLLRNGVNSVEGEPVTDSFSDVSNYMVHRFLSMKPEWIEVVNEIQRYWELEPKSVYQFYTNVIPKSRTFLRYTKSKKKSKIEKWAMDILCDYFEDSSENIEHSTTMTTPMSDNRITIQMFI